MSGGGSDGGKDANVFSSSAQNPEVILGNNQSQLEVSRERVSAYSASPIISRCRFRRCEEKYFDGGLSAAQLRLSSPERSAASARWLRAPSLRLRGGEHKEEQRGSTKVF